MKTNPEVLKVLVAIAKDCREYLQECNVSLRELKENEGKIHEEMYRSNYYHRQTEYITATNILIRAKEAAGRK